MQQSPPLQLDDLPGGPPPGTCIAVLETLPDHGGKDIIFENGNFRANIFVQRFKGEIYVYENRCPHAGTPLNMFDDNFLNMTDTHLVCRTHGALFEVSSGLCVGGPCKGRYLRAIEFEIRNGAIYSL